MPTYRVLVADTRTGAVLDELPWSGFDLKASVDWARGDSLSVSVPLLGARHRSRNRVVGLLSEPWKRSLCLVRGNRAVWAGPLISGDWGQSELSLTCAGLPKLLDKRFIFRDHMESRTVEANARDAIAHLLYWSISEHVENGDERYRLPLTGTDRVGGQNHIERTWYGRDLPTVYESVKKVTEEDGAPDIRLDVQLSANQDFITWNAVYGNPYLGAADPSVAWDYPANIESLTGSMDGSSMVARGYVLGDGQEDDRIIMSAENALAEDGFPYLDGADRTASSSRDVFVVQALADSFTAANVSPAQMWQVSVDPGHVNFDRLTLGDNNVFTLTGHGTLADGQYLRRVTGYSLSPDSLTLETFTDVVVR